MRAVGDSQCPKDFRKTRHNRPENIENHVKFHTGAIDIMSNDVKNIKSNVEEMNVCDNLGDHLVGNVYIKFRYHSYITY